MCLSCVDSHQTRKEASVGGQALKHMLLAPIIELHIKITSPRIQFHHNFLPAERRVVDALETVDEEGVHTLSHRLRLSDSISCSRLKFVSFLGHPHSSHIHMRDMSSRKAQITTDTTGQYIQYSKSGPATYFYNALCMSPLH